MKTQPSCSLTAHVVQACMTFLHIFYTLRSCRPVFWWLAIPWWVRNETSILLVVILLHCASPCGDSLWLIALWCDDHMAIMRENFLFQGEGSCKVFPCTLTFHSCPWLLTVGWSFDSAARTSETDSSRSPLSFPSHTLVVAESFLGFHSQIDANHKPPDFMSDFACLSNFMFDGFIFIFIVYEFQNLAIESFQGVELFPEYNILLREFIL